MTIDETFKDFNLELKCPCGGSYFYSIGKEIEPFEKIFSKLKEQKEVLIVDTLECPKCQNELYLKLTINDNGLAIQYIGQVKDYHEWLSKQ
jgi:hypothetical protein